MRTSKSLPAVTLMAFATATAADYDGNAAAAAAFLRLHSVQV